MPGKKRKNPSNKSDKSGDKRAEGNQRSVTPGEGKQTRSKIKKMAIPVEVQETDMQQTTRKRVTARFVEDDAVVDMEAEGQSTEYAEEDNAPMGVDDSQETESSQDSESESDDSEVILSQVARNNNATVQQYEDGECSGGSQDAVQPSTSSAKGSRPRPSLEDKLNQSLSQMQHYVEEKFAGFAKVVEIERQLALKNKELEELKARGKTLQPKTSRIKSKTRGSSDDEILSETIIYHNAVQKEPQKRGSSSSEDLINTSDESKEEDILPLQLFFTEKELARDRERNHDRDRGHHRRDEHPGNEQDFAEERYDRSTSCEREEAQRKAIQDRSDRLIQEAESSKARIYDMPGREQPEVGNLVVGMNDVNVNSSHQPCYMSALIDENYKLVGSHVDEKLRSMIMNHEYIDFAKLLPRNRSFHEEDQRFQLVGNKGGTQSYWAPIVDKSNSISSYFKWEQAFRVFSEIFTGKYPERACELIQYNHIIHTASLSFNWENVYTYDCEFHVHMSKNPRRNWGVILQQAYTMYIKDRQQPTSSGGNRYESSQAYGGSGGKNRKLCYGYNQGRCKFGNKCRFDHRCGLCNKFGHGASHCRRASSFGLTSADKETGEAGDVPKVAIDKKKF